MAVFSYCSPSRQRIAKEAHTFLRCLFLASLGWKSTHLCPLSESGWFQDSNQTLHTLHRYNFYSHFSIQTFVEWLLWLVHLVKRDVRLSRLLTLWEASYTLNPSPRAERDFEIPGSLLLFWKRGYVMKAIRRSAKLICSRRVKSYS